MIPQKWTTKDVKLVGYGTVLKFHFVDFDFSFRIPLTNSKNSYTCKIFLKSFDDKTLISKQKF